MMQFKIIRNRWIVLAGALVGAAAMQGAACGPGAVLPGGTLANHTPTIRFIQPASALNVEAGAMIELVWNDEDPDDNATITLFYDLDGVAGTGDEITLAVLKEDPDGPDDRFVWDTTGMPKGIYRVGATIDDGVNDPVTVYLPYEVAIRTPQQPKPVVPTFKMLLPAANNTYQPGQSVMLRWTDEDVQHSASIHLYYDPDRIPTNGNEGLIAIMPEDIDGAGDDFGWTIPEDMPNGTYNILGRMTNGVDEDIYSYAPAVLMIGGLTPNDAIRDLSRAYNDFDATIFEGYQNNHRLGEVMNGGADMDGDGFDDFILVSPKGRSSLVNSNVGEAYLIYSRGANRWPAYETISMADVGGYGTTRGAVFVGPRYTSSTSGIQEVQFVEDQDGDVIPEIVFGIPYVDGVVKEEQDYDPIDDDEIHSDEDDPYRPTGFYQVPNFTFPLDGWQPWSSSEPSSDNNPPGMLRSGMVVMVGSNSNLENIIALLDETGQQTVLAHTRVERTNGVRLYPLPGNDNTLWGTSIATADLDGDFLTDLHITRPNADGSRSGFGLTPGTVGSLRTIPLRTMVNWTSELSEMTADNGALVWAFDTEPETWSWPFADSIQLDGEWDDRIPSYPMLWYETPGDAANASAGHLGQAAGLGFFDTDGFEDLATSAPEASLDGQAMCGAVYIIFGEPGFSGTDVSQFRTLEALGYEISGTQQGARFGYKLAGPGDLNGDGLDDMLASAPWADFPDGSRAGCGAVAIVYGRQKYGRAKFTDIGRTVPGAVLYGASAGDNAGLYIAGVGDVDKDGIPDFLIAAPGFDSINGDDAGAVYLIYGGPHLIGDLDLALVGTPELPGKVYHGPEAGAMVGPVAKAGDVDGDGRADFLIAYPGATARGRVNAGRVWLIYGSARAYR